MAMKIYGNYDYSQTNYAEKVKEKQAAEQTQRATEAEKAANAKESSDLPDPRDEYISGEKLGKKPNGLYRVGQDENGNRKIFYDDPNKAERADGKEEPKPEICAGNTDKVDQEIRKLKEKKQQLEQQIQSASGDEKKIRELEKKLAQVEQELSQKDNDSYRRQHTIFS